MKILGIETSSIVASVAITNNNILLGETTINHPKKHSQKLMPIIKNLFSSLNMNINDIDLIAVSNGPGSFTGIRIGLTTAKALAHMSEIPIVTISTLDSLAVNNIKDVSHIVSIIDARRKNVFVKNYTIENNTIISSSEPLMVIIDDYLEEINNLQGEVLLVGSGVTENISYILDNKNENIQIASDNDNFPIAKTLCSIAYKMPIDQYKRYDDVKANYLRKSQAEMTLKKKG
jgi:tRNA threonylcarbamoyladenosine biosynthesis protein TsaB